jgi:nitrogen regulatory protein PII
MLDQTIEVIVGSANGKVGDGKIFVTEFCSSNSNSHGETS